MREKLKINKKGRKGKERKQDGMECCATQQLFTLNAFATGERNQCYSLFLFRIFLLLKCAIVVNT